MRSSMSLVSLLVAAGAAVADATPAQRQPGAPAASATSLAPIDLAAIPEQCRPIAKQAVAPVLPVALSSRISLAACLADVGLAPLQLCDCEDSVLAIDSATKRSVELLDEVIARSQNPATTLTAHRAKAELYTNVTVRMTATIPPPGATEAAIALHEARKTILDGMLVRWRTAAARSYEQILRIAKANPRLERDPAIANAVRIARDRLREQVAIARPPADEPPEPGAGSKEDPTRDAIIKDLDEQETLR